MRTHNILAALACCAAVAAHAAPDTDAQPGDYEFRMAPGKSHEVCMPIKKGHGIEFSFQTDAPVDFNVHYHVGQKVVTPLDVPGVMRQTNRVFAKLDNTYCLMWTATAVSDAGVFGSWKRLPPGAK